MKIQNLLITLTAIIACTYNARADDHNSKLINAESLNSIQVIGRIGVPLGKVAKVRATIVDGESLRMKEHAGCYLLKITEVNGKKPKSEPIVKFSLAPGSDVPLASNDFDLYKLKTGKESGSLSSEQMAELKNGYVGKSLMLYVYESGRFSGIPDNMPKDALIWQDTGFGFHTDLIVLQEVAEK